jgi:hypothetical protein
VSQVALPPAFELIVNSIEGYCNFGALAGALTKNRLFVSAVVPLFAGQVGFVLTPSSAWILTVIFDPELKFA